MKKSVKIIGIVVCVAIIAAAVVGVASRAVRVEDGRRIRKAFNEYAERVVRLRASGEFEDSDDDPALSDWFTAPEGFLPVKDGNVYKSVINPYDTPEEWDLLEDAIEMLLIVLLVVDTMVKASIWDILFHSLVGYIALGVAGICYLIFGLAIMKER